MIDATKGPIDLFIDLLNEADLDVIAGYSNETESIRSSTYKNRFLYLINEWRTYIGIPTKIPTSDLRTLYNFLFNADIGAIKFGKILANNNIRTSRKTVDSITSLCTEITWKGTPASAQPEKPNLSEKTRSCGRTLN
jgi:hypothetical protein